MPKIFSGIEIEETAAVLIAVESRRLIGQCRVSAVLRVAGGRQQWGVCKRNCSFYRRLTGALIPKDAKIPSFFLWTRLGGEETRVTIRGHVPLVTSDLKQP